MKKIFFGIIISVAAVACTNSSKENSKELAQIKEHAITKIKDSLKLDSFKRAEQTARVKEKQHAAQVKEERRVLLLSEQNRAASARSEKSYSEPAPDQKKKGWSQAAKGTAIGAGAGALGGILVDKNDGRGAIIGGVVGAGTGYLIGRGQDRKSGRVKPKN